MKYSPHNFLIEVVDLQRQNIFKWVLCFEIVSIC